MTMNSYESWVDDQPDYIDERCKEKGISRKDYEILQDIVKTFRSNINNYSHGYALEMGPKIKYIEDNIL